MKMEKETRRVRRPGSVCTGVAWLALLLAAAPVTCGQESAERVALTILATTDVHGNVWPYDYLQGQGAERGLAKVSAYVRQVRARQPNTLLVDCGDTFQGTPLAYLAAEKHAEEPNPVVAAMNAMGYDAMAIGNHEWNFGLHTLWRLKEEAQFPILGANVASTYHDRLRDFKPYVIRRVGGVRVALLGIIVMTLFHCGHRIRHVLQDLGLHGMVRVLGVLCYGAALAGSVVNSPTISSRISSSVTTP